MSRKEEAAKHFNSGKIYFQNDNYKEACNEFEKAISIDPDPADYHYFLGLAKFNLRQFEEAADSFREVLKRSPKHIDCHNELGRALANKGEYYEAAMYFRKATELDTKYTRGFFNWGLALFNSEKYREAINKFDEVIQIDANYIDAYVQCGSSYYEIGEYDKAINYCQQALMKDAVLGLDSELISKTLAKIKEQNVWINQFQQVIDNNRNGDSFYRWGNTLYELKRYEKAIDQYKNAIKHGTENEDVYNMWGLSLSKIYSYKDAIKIFQKAIDINPNFHDAYDNCAQSFSFLEQYDNALQCYFDALKNNPDKLFDFNNLSDLIEKIDMHSEVIQRFQKSVDSLNNDEAYNSWGNSLYDLKQFESAIKQYKNALKINPKNKYALYNWGLSLSNLGDHKNALKYYQKVVDLDPYDTDALVNCGKVFYSLKQYKKAIEQYRIAAERNPKSGIDTYNLSLALIQTEDREKEIQLFQETINRIKSAKLFYEWGNVLYNLREFNNAIYQYKNSLDIAPKYEDTFLKWGLCLIETQEYDKAIEKFKGAISINPNSSQAYIYYGRALNLLGKHNEAIKQFQAASECDSIGGINQYDLSTALLRIENQDETISEFQKIVEKHRNEFAYNNWGNTLLALKRYDEAINEYKKIFNLNPTIHYAHQNCALAFFQQRKYNEALAEYRNVIKLKPFFPDSYYYYANCLLETKKYDETIEQYERAVELNPEYAYALHNEAYILEKQGKYKSAKIKWEQAIKAYENALPYQIINRNPDYFQYLGNILHKVFWDFERAERIYKEGLKVDPDNMPILLNLINLYIDKKDEAIENDEATIQERINAHWNAWEYYRKAEKIFEDKHETQKDANFYLNLGELHTAMEENKKAEEALLEAIKFDDDSARAYANLALVHSSKEDYKKAIQYHESSLKRDSDDLDIHNNLAEAYFKNGMKEKAEVEYKKILTIAPYQIRALIGLGEVYSEMAKDDDNELYNDSIAYFSKALKIAFTDKASKKLKKKEIAAVHYSRGYARVRLFESSKIFKDEKLLREASEDFKLCKKYDPNHSQAERAIEKIEKRFHVASTQRLTEKWGPRTILVLAILIFIATQFSFFIGRPVYKDLGLKLTDESLNSLKLEKVPAETLKSLLPIREKIMQEEKFLDEIKNAIGEEKLKNFKDVILEKSIRIKKLAPNEPIEIAPYLLLTFGSFLFMITGLYLPQILKIKVGALEIEKKSVDQIKSIETLGISK